MSKWISVDDRLPLELIDGDDVYRDVEVLVTDGVLVSIHMFAAGSVGEDWREWSNYGDIKPGMITHWMPLPKPPQQ